MKSLIELHLCALSDLGRMCGVCTTKDRETILRRLEHEGLSFLTITLPDFGKDFQKSLSLGRIASDSFSGFRKRRGLPQFLGGFLLHVFDAKSGTVLDDPCTDCVYAIRQITLMFSKILLPCSQARERAAFRGYVECEKELKEADVSRDASLEEAFGAVASDLFAQLFSDVDREVAEYSLRPKHGPGSTADGLLGNQKYVQRMWTDRLECVSPFGEYALPSWRYFNHDDVQFLEPGAELPVKVISVPKTLKTPRIIAIEPTCMQYVQQAVSRSLVEKIGKSNQLDAFLGFDDQVPNQALALKGSVDGSLATLDLSEASDRVSNQLVRRLFQRHPHLFEIVDASRSRRADVPGHGVLRLAKYASMGSALTFPVEAMVFLVIVFMVACEQTGHSVRDVLKSHRGLVRIYGDDIIVPREMAPVVIERLEDFGFRVNRHKSFWNGQFRESCGKEYFAGSDVSVVKVRRELPKSRADTEELASLVSFRNQAYWNGLWTVAAYCDEVIRSFIPFPIVESTSSALGRGSIFPYQGERESIDLQRPEVKAAVIAPRPRMLPLDNWGALLKFFLKDGDEPIEGEHLKYSGRPYSVRTKIRWVTPF